MAYYCEVNKKPSNDSICSICGYRKAVVACDGCDAPLCRECRNLEIWGTGSEDLSPRYFCNSCFDDPEINPWGAHDKACGISELIDTVRNVEKDAPLVQKIRWS